jgi:hypothetical protein
MAQIIEADGGCDLRDGLGGHNQHGLGFPDPSSDNIVHGRVSQFFLEKMREIGGTYVKLLADLLQRQIFGIVFVNILFDMFFSSGSSRVCSVLGWPYCLKAWISRDRSAWVRY